MPSEKRKFGDRGEALAEEYLKSKGYEILDHNFLRPWGEIDLITKKNDLLVFIEVKTRDAKNIENYLAEYSVNRAKVKKLQKICETYLSEKRYPNDQNWQIDVLAISIDEFINKNEIKHFENAVWE